MKWSYPVALAILAGCGAVASDQDGTKEPAADAWEVTIGHTVNWDDCKPVEPPLVRPLNAQSRGEGVAMLRDVSFIEVTDAEGARLTGAGKQSHATNAERLISNYLDEMRVKKRRATVERRGSWSLEDENEFAFISRRSAAEAYRGYKPYLVRAIAKNEGTGTFYVYICGDDLEITHGSLGHSVPQSQRVPLVIYLKRQPQRVFAAWAMAE
jgi:hypothetical protein